MTAEEIKSHMTMVFRDVLDLKHLELTRETTGEDIEEWDSLSNISLIAAIETEFQVTFQLAEITSLRNVGDMFDLVQRRVS